jgi:hypothetical protein
MRIATVTTGRTLRRYHRAPIRQYAFVGAAADTRRQLTSRASGQDPGNRGQVVDRASTTICPLHRGQASTSTSNAA